jgi:hypothetical protein
MSTLLAVQSCSSCSPALLRHWECFQRQKADYEVVIVTEDKPCQTPPGVPKIEIGIDKYMDGPHLPNRLINSIERLLERPWGTLILCEYDTLILKRIRVEAMEHGIAAHLAGFRTWGSRANSFFHNPYVMLREWAIRFVDRGRSLLKQGIDSGSPESSPDVFFGWVVQEGEFPVQFDLWQEYSRNSLDVEGHLQEARQAYLDGVDVIHGVKTLDELQLITA